MAKIKHIAIATQDPETTAAYYKKVFDLREVGRVDTDNAEGYYLTDGHVNLAILRYKSDVLAGDAFGTAYSGIHHIGFQVDDAAETDARLRAADSMPLEAINSALRKGMGDRHGGRNVEMKYNGPDGVMLDVSQNGWVGTDSG